MKHLKPYSLFEDRTSSVAGTLPKIDMDQIGGITGKKIDHRAKEKVGDYVSNWFQSIGNGIEKLGGDLIKDPEQWRKEYKDKLPGYTVTSANGTPTRMTTDSGFSDIVGGGVAMSKGVLSKMFGDSENLPPVKDDASNITPEHQRIFMDNNRAEITSHRTQGEMNKWVMDKYKDAGLKPGQSQGFDQTMQAAETNWLSSDAGVGAIKSAGTVGAEVGGAEAAGFGLGELAEVAPLLIL